MSVSATSATSASITSQVLQQLLTTSGSQSLAGLPSGVLQEVLQGAEGGQASAGAPAAVTQALGDLLSGTNAESVQADLDELQGYFKSNPDAMTGVLTALQDGGTTYTAQGTLASSSSLVQALAGTSGASSQSSILELLLDSQSQDPLLASLGGSSSGGSALSLLG
jgi:hypothetical protein